MVDYIDDDGDNDPDEMDIRYFENGDLRSVWCGMDLDDDSKMWDLTGYEYSADFFKSDPYGDGMIYMNKFDPTRGRWVPISECPFAFYDTDGRRLQRGGRTPSVRSMSYTPGRPRLRQRRARYRGHGRRLDRIGIANIRYSSTSTPQRPRTPLPTIRFNLVGATPTIPWHASMSNRSAPAQDTIRIPWKNVHAVADRFAAKEPAVSWTESATTPSPSAPPRTRK